MYKNSSGVFILIEGGDGTGKTTLGDNLKKLLEESGSEVVMVNEPNEDLESGRMIRAMLRREIPRPDTLLGLQEVFVTHRGEHFDQVVYPALQSGQMVVSVRSYPSTFAYGSLQPGVGAEAIRDLHERVLGKRMLHADITFYIQLDAETAAMRQEQTGKEKEIFDDLEKQRDIIKAYEAVLRDEPFIAKNSTVIFLNGEMSPWQLAETAHTHICLYLDRL